MQTIIDTINRHKYILILAVIIIFSSLLIFNGSDWGLPSLLHGDEVTIVNPAIQMVQNRTFEPNVFMRPDHLLIQINMLIYRVIVFLYGESIDNIYDIGTHVFHLAARVVTGVFAIGSTVVAYFIGKKYSEFVGIVSAFLFAFFPRFITHSHFATPDVPTVFFMLLFIYVSLNYMQKSNIINLLLMSLVTALFIMVKYPGAILCLMIAFTVIASSIIEKKYLRILKHGASAILSMIFFIFLISPVLILRFSDVRNALINEARDYHLGIRNLGWGGNMLFYINNYLSASGVILLVFLLIGCYSLFSQKSRIKSLPLFSGLVFWICLSYLPLHWERWGLPMYVTPLLISAIGIGWVYDKIKTSEILNKRKKLCYAILSAFMFISGMNLVTMSYGNLLNRITPDTRVVSQSWISENNINVHNTVFEGYTTLNPTSPGQMFHAFEIVDDTVYLKQNRHQYIITSSLMRSRFMREPERFADYVLIYNSLDENFTEIMRFRSTRGTSRSSSLIDIVSIYHNIDHIIRASAPGVITGPTLIFYEASSDNFIPYIFSTPIYFDNANRSFDRYFITGLSGQEAYGIWTSGFETEFLFFLPDTVNDLNLSFLATPLVSELLPSQIVEIVANNESLGVLEIEETGVYNVTIPYRLIGDNRLNLRFLFHTATSPEHLQISEDNRILALFFQEMTICEN